MNPHPTSARPPPRCRRLPRMAGNRPARQASDSVPSATPSGETPSTASASVPSGSPDVARTLTLAERPVVISIAAPAAFSRCSQLSITSSSRLHRGLGRARCRREGRAEAVWFGGEHVPSVTFDRLPHYRVVDRRGGCHLGRRLVPPAHGILDAGEQERHRSRRWADGHISTLCEGGAGIPGTGTCTTRGLQRGATGTARATRGFVPRRPATAQPLNMLNDIPIRRPRGGAVLNVRAAVRRQWAR